MLKLFSSQYWDNFLIPPPPPGFVEPTFFQVCRGLSCSLTCMTDQWASHRWPWVEDCPMSCGWAGFCRPPYASAGRVLGSDVELGWRVLKKKKKKKWICASMSTLVGTRKLCTLSTLWGVTLQVDLVDVSLPMWLIMRLECQTITPVWILHFKDPCYLKRFY